jgi:nitroreductase
MERGGHSGLDSQREDRMDVMTAIRERHSVRSFTDQPVPRELIEELVEAAGLAPSSFNSQPWRFHVATHDTLERVCEIMSLTTTHIAEYLEMLGPEVVKRALEFYTDLGGAPVVVAMSIPEPEDDLGRINEFLAAGAAMQNMLLAAVEKGLGTCSLSAGFWVRDQLQEALQVPEGRTIITMIVVGYPAEQPMALERRTDTATIFE